MEALRRLSIYLKPYRRAAILAPLLMVVEVAMDLMQPRLMQRIIDDGIGQKDLDLVLQTGGVMLLVAFIGALGGLGCTVFAVRAGINFGADLRAALFRKVQTLSFGNLDRIGTCKIVTRLTNDVEQVQQLVLMALRVIVRMPLLAVGSFIMAATINFRLTLLMAVLAPFVISTLYLVVRHTYPLYSILQDNIDRLNIIIQENLAGVRVVKAFVQHDHEKQRFADANATLTASSIQAMQLSAVARPVIFLFVNLGIAGLVYFGGFEVDHGAMTVGELIAFVNYMRRALIPLMMVSMLLMRVARAQASAVRILEIFDAEPDIQDRPGALNTFAPSGRLAVEGVTFSYDDGEPVLQDVSFTAEPGQTLAILGATGSGKSSLLHLIPRFYDVDEGRVTIDGVDVREVEQAELRKHIGVSLQEAVLFSGTIRSNLRYGNEYADDTQLEGAAQAAQAHPFIAALPEGYDTRIGQRGVNLSGGQKQRMAIARALVRDPAILLLDDSTSAVDVETEGRIQDALAESPKTRVIVAQRISSVLHADKILVLENGRLVAEGNHAELMASSPIYREIYDSQLGNGGEVSYAAHS